MKFDLPIDMKPCPKCSSEDGFSFCITSPRNLIWVACGECGYNGPQVKHNLYLDSSTGNWDNLPDAIKAWNEHIK